MQPPLALADLEGAVLGACNPEDQWPARVAAGIYAGVDFAIAHPALAHNLAEEGVSAADNTRRYDEIITRLAGLIAENAPSGQRLPGSMDQALIAGVVGLVGDHLRIGKVDRLLELRPDLVLLALLPYLGFSEAQRWANHIAESWTGY